MRIHSLVFVLSLSMLVLVGQLAGCDKGANEAPALHSSMSMPASAPDTAPATSATTAAATMAAAAPFCATCQMSVDPKDSETQMTVYKGHVYLFCSKSCKAEFLQDPEKAVAKLPADKFPR